MFEHHVDPLSLIGDDMWVDANVGDIADNTIKMVDNVALAGYECRDLSMVNGMLDKLVSPSVDGPDVGGDHLNCELVSALLAIVSILVGEEAKKRTEWDRHNNNK
ncbi:hypothetical protein FISHEDRAFT_59481 [Fistulina hepatica ATCC 64428]|uniref:Uncharacterized protein n=1 Tax=Fistulina hepatica ATCC 64428 TaxID=1128425 RepID=A0A0D7A9D7_9AGAR|nr:hypothetical protein FISHEDRAFT_59481 [Fistulina hepatica ATCC 64428]